MQQLTVNQVAKLSGVSVRALHHYDAIGLLKPASLGENRYRYYGEEELLRLQQILIHRELGIPLGEIAAILDAPGFDRLKALQSQRERLAAEAKRYAQLVRTIDRTIASLQGDRVMKNADLYKGIAPEKQAEYEAWLVDRYGGDMEERVALSRKAYAELGEEQKQQLQDELYELEQGLAEGLRRGLPLGSPSLDPLLRRHREWVAFMWGRPCPPDAYAGLADLYLSHPDFVARYEAIEPGFAEYLAGSMKVYARRLAG
jgi:DNA-binding transcriptional MerR regulator